MTDAGTDARARGTMESVRRDDVKPLPPSTRTMPDPYRVLFPIGIAAAFVALLPWVAQALSGAPWWPAALRPAWPGPAHAAIMMQGFELAFVCGFLLTAMPAFTHGARATRAELGVVTAGVEVQETGHEVVDPQAGEVGEGLLGLAAGCGDLAVQVPGLGRLRRGAERRRREAIGIVEITSRERPTEDAGRITLARTMAAAGEAGPRVLLSTSAIGFYGDRGDEKLTEQSPAGEGFLAGLARDWEAAAEPARQAGVRVVHPRIGIVLSPQAGALEKLAPPFLFGAGGPLADGRAWWSWITLHDLLDLLLWAVEDDRARGPINAVAPRPVRQRDFARALGRVLSRPSLAPVPAFALRTILGREQADEMLLGSQHVLPWMLEAAGFTWRDPELEPALAALYGRPRLTPIREGRA